MYPLKKLDKELLPSVSFDHTIVVVEIKDMPATDVEQFVSKPIEQVLTGISGNDVNNRKQYSFN
ncbi:hypothetical protein H1Z61_14785 [Bacillus aquiflavi]|uniref:Uncharacterized protein n=1 Tax=Bacillus aquiflavi TaxID=2672567 RepID=A0A6B3VZP7_9BACI|nr:hypothetical protein [Bacillus aquiflavi]MBA4538363.1 hypothetical protein [Bacillus aquiflavi]NEY82728.1 hypothetical protein [Bacillus aquiflavi]UAC49521.1 hypothetical protein K6959_06750 [Bacillus aquiflavi]